MCVCHTPFFGKDFDKYRNEFVLVDGHNFLGHLGLAHHYGFKKAITVMEICVLFPGISIYAQIDFFGSKEKMQGIA